MKSYVIAEFVDAVSKFSKEELKEPAEVKAEKVPSIPIKRLSYKIGKTTGGFKILSLTSLKSNEEGPK